MSRQECIEGINDMLEKLHSKDLKRMNDFISGFTFALVRQDEKESERHEYTWQGAEHSQYGSEVPLNGDGRDKTCSRRGKGICPKGIRVL